MIFWIIRQVQKFIQILNDGGAPTQIAAGFALGGLLGFVPFNFVYYYLIFCVIIFFNVNITSSLFASVFCALLSPLLDPWAHKLGAWLLIHNETFTPLWTQLSNIPIMPLTNFNNTVMMGSFVLALLLWFPLFFLMRAFVIKYRKSWREKIEKSKFMHIFKLFKVTEWIAKYR